MHAIELLREPEKVPVVPVYAVYGDDVFLRREALDAIRRVNLPGEDDALSIGRFDGAQAKLADVLDEVQTLPFFAKRRVALVENADTFVTAHRKELEGYVEHPSTSGALILSVKSWPATTRLAKLTKDVGLAVDCKGPSDRTLLPWLSHLAKSRFGVTLEANAAELLLELVGPEVGLLVGELDKLSVYVGGSGKVRREDVARTVGAGRIETVWKVIDAATTGRGDLALEQLDGLITAGEDPPRLLAAMTTSLLKVYSAGRLRRLRVDLAEACATAGIPPWAVDQTRQQHAHLGPARVDQLPSLLLRADLDLKGSSMLRPRAVLERLLVELSSPRKD